jgi:hypothetical protein
VHHGWHGTHRYDIQVLATNASTWGHRYSSLPQLLIPCTNGLLCRRVRCVVCTKWTFNCNHRLTLVIFQHTKQTSPPERPFSHYIHSHRLAAEMWTAMKNKFLGGKNLSCFFYLYGFRKYVSYGFSIINFCNRGVHYETPCIYAWELTLDSYEYSYIPSSTRNKTLHDMTLIKLIVARFVGTKGFIIRYSNDHTNKHIAN